MDYHLRAAQHDAHAPHSAAPVKTPVERAGEMRPVDAWERLGWLMASVWLVFLIFPLSAAIAVVGTGWKILAIGLVLSFGCYYFWIWRSPRENRSWVNLTVLFLLACATYPLIGLNALSMVPFLVAYTAFAFSSRVSYAVMVLWLLGTATVLGIAGGNDEWWYMMVPSASVAVMTGVIRFIDDRQQQTQELQDQYVAANERERIARDLHDVLGQSLTAIALKAQVAERVVTTHPEVAVAELQAIQELSRSATKDVRDTVGVLRARDLTAELAAAREVIATADIAFSVRGTATDVDPDCRQPFAWALRETITNVARHSHARSCIVTLEPRRLVVADDGVGRGSSHPGNGLRGLTARIAERGGHVRVVDAKGEAAASRNGDPEHPGTRVEVSL